PEAPADPWKNSKLRAAMHGLLYGLPTVCFPAAAGLLSGLHVLRALIVALLTSWALSQALAYVGYARLGRAGSAGAALLLVLGAEGLLLVLLAPGVLGSAAFLLLGRPAHLEHAVWATLAATPLLAL